ncbi:hypothetical protein, partial [Streptomyces rhizosphaericus]|uniref:hypothetical protein n=1 Tax=Streptomyces rhizosphaericus TaxID=114699 RepID=UPI0031CFAC26
MAALPRGASSPDEPWLAERANGAGNTRASSVPPAEADSVDRTMADPVRVRHHAGGQLDIEVADPPEPVGPDQSPVLLFHLDHGSTSGGLLHPDPVVTWIGDHVASSRADPRRFREGYLIDAPRADLVAWRGGSSTSRSLDTGVTG